MGRYTNMRTKTRETFNGIISTINIPVDFKQKIVNLVEELEAQIESKNHEIHHLSQDNVVE